VPETVRGFSVLKSVSGGYVPRVPAMQNPALSAFLDGLETETVFGQVLVRRVGDGFELRHVEDRAEEGLRPLVSAAVRSWVQFTETGAFRALKSAPNLRRGWRLTVSDGNGLAGVLDVLYPGGLADWFAARQSSGSAIDFRGFVERQTGMYRIAAMLTDDQAGRVTKACCAPTLCLKRRLWTVPGQEADLAGKKSLIPCLEPCALFLEFARKAMRIEQEAAINLVMAPSDLAAVRAALSKLAQTPAVREGDVASSENPRRALLALAKLDDLPEPAVVDGE
jgi:hypothetical protein